MEWTFLDTINPILALIVSVLSILGALAGCVLWVVRRQYTKTEAEFELLDDDRQREISFLERQLKEVKEQRDMARADLAICKRDLDTCTLHLKACEDRCRKQRGFLL